MKRKLTAVIMAAFLIAAVAVPAAAASTAEENPLTREYTFETDDRNFDYRENRTIEVDGKKYKAKGIDYELVSKTQRAAEHRSFSGLTSRTVPESITLADGKELTLESVEYTPQPVTNVQVYRDYVNPPEIPDKLNFTVNGITVSGSRVGTERHISDTYNVPFSVNGKFYGDEDSMYYVLNGKNIPAGTAPEFDQYPAELLAYLKLSPDIYRIDSGQWASGYYTEGEETVRMATYNGMQKSNTYTVTYKGTVYTAEAVYSNGLENTEPIYTVKATVEYEKAGLTAIDMSIAGSGLMIVALVCCLAYVLAKRKRRFRTAMAG